MSFFFRVFLLGQAMISHQKLVKRRIIYHPTAENFMSTARCISPTGLFFHFANASISTSYPSGACPGPKALVRLQRELRGREPRWSSFCHSHIVCSGGAGGGGTCFTRVSGRGRLERRQAGGRASEFGERLHTLHIYFYLWYPGGKEHGTINAAVHILLTAQSSRT